MDLLIPDLIVFDRIIVDTKTEKAITEHDPAQMPGYLKTTKVSLGPIIDFSNSKVEIKRVQPLKK
ncbi:MAG: GxxExxY protein [Verrucomicrobia bacterium]|nr:MAG: GxxExxY protein [Verrucomicrobiota bacterium]TAE89282.1 MAG: GxxExxY protein [Verrucomicrobiota bacterium]TAF27844.1 MAG: GxxExxY protein [Verrucomicrobiota bacterium]TAF42693.1 MAG: GxxExxY protein [Verrucomicrobiota bacterium]